MKKSLISIVMMFSFAMTALASPAEDLTAKTQETLVDIFGPRLQVSEAVFLENKQLIEVELKDSTVMYLTPDMNFLFFNGKLYELAESGPVDVAEKRINPKRKAALANIADKDTVIFSAKGEQKAVINVFTDIECHFCQKLHQEVPELNQLGVTVRYLAYPRAGVVDFTGKQTDSYKKINAVWCAKENERQSEMTKLKAAQYDLSQLRQGGGLMLANRDSSKIEKVLNDAMRKGSCESPVADQLDLGGGLGVTGTPAIITEDGSLIPGYMPAKDLAARLGVQ